MNRSTKDLITELETEAKKHTVCLIVVGFENTSIFIRPEDADRLKLLNDAVEAGGVPIGLIAADRSGDELRVSTRIYPEYSEEGEEVARTTEYMDRLADQVRKQLLEKFTN